MFCKSKLFSLYKHSHQAKNYSNLKYTKCSVAHSASFPSNLSFLKINSGLNKKVLSYMPHLFIGTLLFT